MRLTSASLPVGLILFGAATRVFPYVLHALGVADIYDPNGMPWNVSPVAAIALFSGYSMTDRRSFLVPLATMLLSDLGIGLLMGDIGFGFHALIPASYGCLLLTVWLGGWLRGRSHASVLTRLLAIGGTALVCELVFFVITNFANWAMQGSIGPRETALYPYTPTGLMACYIAAIPFFKKSLIGMAVYGTALFGGYELLFKRAPAPSPAMLADAR